MASENTVKFFMPGEKILKLDDCSEQKVVIGTGLKRQSSALITTKAGVLRHKEPNVWWVDSCQKKYVPTRGDDVLGIVTNKGGDIFRVDVGASETASLSYLAFEGATKKNRPDVQIGDIVYAKFLVANKDMETELVCIDSTGRSSGLGVIRDGGMLFTCSLGLIRKLRHKDCTLLKALGNLLPYEIAIGMNGRIWVKGRSVRETILIMNAIDNSEFLPNDQMKVMVKRLMDGLHGF